MTDDSQRDQEQARSASLEALVQLAQEVITTARDADPERRPAYPVSFGDVLGWLRSLASKAEAILVSNGLPVPATDEDMEQHPSVSQATSMRALDKEVD